MHVRNIYVYVYLCAVCYREGDLINWKALVVEWLAVIVIRQTKEEKYKKKPSNNKEWLRAIWSKIENSLWRDMDGVRFDLWLAIW
jgi:hypothetical protein